MPRPRRRLRPVASVAVLAMCLAGCAGIPTSGPVLHGDAIGVERQGDALTRSLPQPPRAGSNQQQIIEGFLNASVSSDNDHGVAREFLTPDAAKTWNPSAGVTIYDSSPATGHNSYKAVGSTDVVFSAAKVGTISLQGEYNDASGDLVVDFKMRKVDGKWRIAAPPTGLLLTPGDLDRSYRVYDIYFPDPRRFGLVPNQVLLPIGPGTSTALMRALISGPTPWLAPAVSTAIPTGTKLVVDSAPITDGIVQVDLSAQAATAIDKEAQALSAQVVWTLRQLVDVTAVRITVNGVPLRGVPAVQGIDSWRQWDPAGATSNSEAYYSGADRLFSLDHDKPAAVPGQAGDGTFPLHQPGVSFDESEVAGLDAKLQKLYVTKLTAGAKMPAAVITGATRLTAPTWDRFGQVWTVDQRADGPVVWVDTPGAAAKKVQTDGLPDGRILAMRISRDGARVVVVAQPTGQTVGLPWIGRVERGAGRLVLSGLKPIKSVFSDVSDAAWVSADLLLLLGRVTSGATPQPLIVNLMGGSVRALGPIDPSAVSTQSIVSITAAPNQEVLASTNDGKLYRYRSIGWDKLADGRYPAYPG